MFAGREKEIQKLLKSFNKAKGTLNVIKGRRRIGKTKLIKHLPVINKRVTLRYLTSSPPNLKVSDADERELYAEQVKSEFNLGYMPPHSTWRELFSFIGDICIESNLILAIDEVNWLATKSPVFMSVFFELWENQFTQKKSFMIILSGSLSSWIEENILMNKGFVGRISVSITLKELPLKYLQTFFNHKIKREYSVDIIKMLSAVGSVPRYLEELDITQTAETNLQRLAFDDAGFLYDEFEKMFYDLFSKENQFYRKILEQVGSSRKLLTAKELATKMNLTYSGRHTKAIKVLEEVGFLSKQFSWDIVKKSSSKTYVLRITDNYTAFYFRAIAKFKTNSLVQAPKPTNLASLLGLQFENLTHNNISFILSRLNIESKDVRFAGFHFQSQTKIRQSCQIDLLIHVKNRVYICECKLYSEEITGSIISEVKQKINKLPQIKGVSYEPVLIHGNLVADSVVDSDYFNEIIDLSDSIFI